MRVQQPIIPLVSGDEGVDVDFTITDQNASNAAINLLGSTVRLYFKEINATTLRDTIVCSFITDGSDGRCRARLTAACMATPAQCIGEIEVENVSQRQTVYDVLRFSIRQQEQV